MGLVGDGELPAPFLFLVVVVSQHLLLVVLLDEVQAEVEPHQVGLIPLHDLVDLGAPEVVELPVRTILEQPFASSIVRATAQSIQVVHGTVESGESRIGDIAITTPVRIEPPLLEVVEGGHETHSVTPDRLLQFADHIALWAHSRGVPLVDLTVPEGEPVVVFGDRARESGAG